MLQNHAVLRYLWFALHPAARACYSEWNNTVLNLIEKARTGYRDHAVKLFGRSDVRFSIDKDWCSHLYLNGVIDKEETKNERGGFAEVCRFANPFVQLRIYNALTDDLIEDRPSILPLHPLDELADVFDKPEIDVPALLERYKDYLKRLRDRGVDPWKDQPRRSDLRLTEYVGHFHLYFWLQNAVSSLCAVSPEFPTGNGRVDLHLQCENRQAVIEVKSFRDRAEIRHSTEKAAQYARKLNLPAIALAVFVPVDDEKILNELSKTHVTDGIRVTVVAIGWV